MVESCNRTERVFLKGLKLLNNSLNLNKEEFLHYEDSRKERTRRISSIDRNKLHTLNVLVKVVSNEFKQSVEDIRGHSRKREAVIPRSIFAYISRTHFKMTYKSIADFLYGMDHSSVVYYIKESVPNLLFNEPKLKDNIIRVVTEFYKSNNNGSNTSRNI